MDAAFARLKLKKEISIAEAEAEALASATAEMKRGSRNSNIGYLPHQPPKERTSKYLACHSKQHQSLHLATMHISNLSNTILLLSPMPLRT